MTELTPLLDAPILHRRVIADEHSVLRLAAPAIAATAEPGQFVMVRSPESWDPLLPRAYSVYDADAGWLEILYRVVGRGTRRLDEHAVSSRLRVWGPLGNAFTPPPTRRAVLVGGGVGVPPLVFWARRLAERGQTDSLRALIGAANAEYLIGIERLGSLGAEVRTATDDGSAGHRGYVTELLSALPDEAIDVYACGPMGMLAAVARVCANRGWRSELALEAPMACGMGACLGCTVPSSDGGYLRVCTDGPVFPGEAIAWPA